MEKRHYTTLSYTFFATAHRFLSIECQYKGGPRKNNDGEKITRTKKSPRMAQNNE